MRSVCYLVPMEKYLCGTKALDYWQIGGVKEELGLADEDEYVVFSEKRIARPGNTHVCRFLKAGQYTDRGVCTLPYLFLRYAACLELVPLIYLGLQICGRDRDREPLCTARKLKSCALGLKGHDGRRKALQAVQYICDNSFSPWESWLHMLLCLPNHLGGCGFPKAVFNQKVQIGTHTFMIDIYFPEDRFGVEYDSFQFHNNCDSFSRDSLRHAKLQAAGYSIVHVRPGQLEQYESFFDLVFNISRALHKPMRIRSPQYFARFQELFHFFNRGGYRQARVSDFPRFDGMRKAYEEYLRKRGLE